MKLIHTTDCEHYRRWINLIPSLLFPGSAQYLSGRRRAGVAWFVSYLVCAVLLVGYLVHPNSPYSVITNWPYRWAMLLLTLAIASDALRQPIRRLHFKGWVLFLCVWLVILILPILTIRTFFVHPFNKGVSSIKGSVRTYEHRRIGPSQDRKSVV
jgi:hypothetical protein